MLSDLFENHGDFYPSLDWSEVQSLKCVTDRLFTFLTSRPIDYPEDITFSINEDGYREARYFIPNLNIGNHLIFPELVLVTETSFDNGSSLLKATIDIQAMDIDDYHVGFMSHNSSHRFAPFTSYWIEDGEVFHPVSMTTQFYVDGYNYQLAFSNQGKLLEARSNNTSILRHPNNPNYTETGRVSEKDNIDLQRFMIKVSEILSTNGIHSNFRKAPGNLISIPTTHYFATRDIGYNITQSGDIIPLLIYR